MVDAFCIRICICMCMLPASDCRCVSAVGEEGFASIYMCSVDTDFSQLFELADLMLKDVRCILSHKL